MCLDTVMYVIVYFLQFLIVDVINSLIGWDAIVKIFTCNVWTDLQSSFSQLDLTR